MDYCKQRATDIIELINKHIELIGHKKYQLEQDIQLILKRAMLDALHDSEIRDELFRNDS